jgi:hypothetical protein
VSSIKNVKGEILVDYKQETRTNTWVPTYFVVRMSSERNIMKAKLWDFSSSSFRGMKSWGNFKNQILGEKTDIFLYAEHFLVMMFTLFLYLFSSLSLSFPFSLYKGIDREFYRDTCYL